MRRLAALLVALLPAAVAAEAAPRTAAFFRTDFINMSLEPVSADETRRVEEMGRRLVAALEAAGAYAFVDAGPAEAAAARYATLTHCNGCDAALARSVGAEVAVTAEVQKTSNLILHMSVYLRDAATGALVGGGSVDIRGNTDESWRRGIDWIVRRRLLAR